ncbi:hypothetical protein SeMB42_g02063 [Synchytrium endobioticum]|uniref:Uncharacterized protein n=1 Tax=Synchytrium endobioticum TaxID=286115 RepID=A0A507DH73_9FUNG|nr:hypothetical protein SeMB42_g02063 [Synchytrium endobioticum]
MPGVVGAQHPWMKRDNSGRVAAALVNDTSTPTVAAAEPSAIIATSIAPATPAPAPAPIASPLLATNASVLFRAALSSADNRCPGYQGDNCATNPCYKNLSQGTGESWLLLAPDRQSFQWNYIATGMKYMVRCYAKTIKNTSTTGTSFGESGGWGFDNWRLLDIKPGSDPQPYVSNSGNEDPNTIDINFPSGSVPWHELMKRLFSREVFIVVGTDSGSGDFGLNNCYNGEIGGFYTVTSYGATAIPSPLGSAVVPPPGANEARGALPTIAVY